MIRRICALIPLALLAASPASGEAGDDFARSGMYLQAGGAYSLQLFTGNSRPFTSTDSLEGTTDTRSARDTAGFNLRAGGRVHPDRPHKGEVDHHPPIADRMPGDIVGAAANGYGKLLVEGEVDSGNDIGGALAAYNQLGSPIDHGVPNRAGGIIAVVFFG